MSNPNSTFNVTSSSTYSTTSTINGQTTGSSYSQLLSSNPQGTTVESTRQAAGEAPVTEIKRYDAHGREVPDGGGDQPPVTRDVTDADKKYEEAIEDEFAKREGGA